jgi:endonuclease/exonuclease/phosphatase family metal-dependent hydrolase
MSSDNAVSLQIGWWNTSLAPLAAPRAGHSDKEFALSIIGSLIGEYGIDCLALGEVTGDLLNEINAMIGDSDYSTLDCATSVGRLRFDVGLIYRKSRMHIFDKVTITSEYGTGSLKVAQRLDLQLPVGQKPLHLFVVHWPSRLWCHENSAKRDNLGICLRNAARSLVNKYSVLPQMIIIGDFNDDPFDQSLAGHLLATRDRTMVHQSPSYFYNPFWRFIGESDPHKPNVTCDSICGTYLQRTGSEETRWRTFDQIILSSALLGVDEWQLNEEHTKIVRIQSLVDKIKQEVTIFDHLPVMTRLEIMRKGSV